MYLGTSRDHTGRISLSVTWLLYYQLELLRVSGNSVPNDKQKSSESGRLREVYLAVASSDKFVFTNSSL